MDDAVEHLWRVVEPVEALAQDKSRGEDIAEIYFAAVARAHGPPGPATATGRCAQTRRETRRASPAMLPARGACNARQDAPQRAMGQVTGSPPTGLPQARGWSQGVLAHRGRDWTAPWTRGLDALPAGSERAMPRTWDQTGGDSSKLDFAHFKQRK